MPPKTASSKLFGYDIEFTYSETWIAYALLSLRLMMGWVFFYAGIVKVIDPDWSARPFLVNVDPANPLVDVWAAMADWVWLLTPLNQVGLTLVGIALILGAFFRFSALCGALMMLFYWAASYPFPDAIFIDFHLIYAFLLFLLGAAGAGRIIGLDQRLEEIGFVQNNPRLALLLG
ncbi:DoxX family protein [Halorubrum sp. T3]|uniref:DoxX family protein n=1 Tax=Halorubrum sp. T3 TaxID=1194088 RepID=UPI00037C6B49|nr:DoxX family protein [Halorubrum sp. T3]